MKFYGFIMRTGNENLSFAVAVFKGSDGFFYIQSTRNQPGRVGEFIKINVNDSDIKKSTYIPSFEKNENDLITYVFIDHNGDPIICEKDKMAELKKCYTQVFFSMFEVMHFLGKKDDIIFIKEKLFPEYINSYRKTKKIGYRMFPYINRAVVYILYLPRRLITAINIKKKPPLEFAVKEEGNLPEPVEQHNSETFSVVTMDDEPNINDNYIDTQAGLTEQLRRALTEYDVGMAASGP